MEAELRAERWCKGVVAEMRLALEAGQSEAIGDSADAASGSVHPPAPASPPPASPPRLAKQWAPVEAGPTHSHEADEGNGDEGEEARGEEASLTIRVPPALSMLKGLEN